MEKLNKITYVKGDATNPIGEGVKIITHIVNNRRAWGAGFVLALSKKWPEPEDNYRMYAPNSLRLGAVDYVMVESINPRNKIFVANMIAQHGTGKDANGDIPLRYTALTDCLRNVNEMAEFLGASVHMPMIGAGLAGGDWNTIEQIIRETIKVPVTVYQLK